LTLFDFPNEDELMINRSEGYFQGADNNELYYQKWSASDSSPQPSSPQANGTLVVTHGISEHSDCYSLFANNMAPMGWDIISWDLQGHGRSEGKRGYVPHFEDYSRDLDRFVRFLKEKNQLPRPYVILGHSMGGLISLRYLIDHPTDGASALCLSSPLLGVSVEVPPIKDLAAKVFNRLWPTLTMTSEIHYEYLTRDPEVLANYPLDSLRHDKISAGVYLGMFENIAFVKKYAADIHLPVLMQLAGFEKIVSTPAAQAFFETIGSEKKKLIAYPDSMHEIFNDLDRKQVYADLDAFLKSILE
jgi:alpha-beta hydrolase superfamily lysophospholipase